MKLHASLAAVIAALSVATQAESQGRFLIGTAIGGGIGASTEAACTRAGKTVVIHNGEKRCGQPLDAAGKADCTRRHGALVVLSGKTFCGETAELIEGQ